MMRCLYGRERIYSPYPLVCLRSLHLASHLMHRFTSFSQRVASNRIASHLRTSHLCPPASPRPTPHGTPRCCHPFTSPSQDAGTGASHPQPPKRKAATFLSHAHTPRPQLLPAAQARQGQAPQGLISVPAAQLSHSLAIPAHCANPETPACGTGFSRGCRREEGQVGLHPMPRPPLTRHQEVYCPHALGRLQGLLRQKRCRLPCQPEQPSPLQQLEPAPWLFQPRPPHPA